MAKKQVVPKKVAGVPVPQAVRNSGTVQSVLSSPVGRKLLADAMLAAAGAAAAILLKRKRGSAEAKRADLTQEVLRAAAGAVTVGLGRAALRQIGPTAQLREEEPARGRRKTAGRKTAAKKTAAKKTAPKKRAPKRKAKKKSA